MIRKLTKKEKGFVRDYVETGNGTVAALKNYNVNSTKTAGSIATENLTKPVIIEAIKNLANEIPNKLVIEKHLELLKRTEIRVINDSDGNPKVFDTGKADINALHYGLDMAYKLKGSYAPIKQVNANVNFGKLEEMTNDELLKLSDDNT